MSEVTAFLLTIMPIFCVLGAATHAVTQPAKRAVETWPLDRFKPDQKELDRHDDADEVRRLGQDMQANGQLQPVGATEDGRIIFGHGRWLAAKSAEIKALEVKVFPASLSDTQFTLIRAAENLQRKDLTAYRKWLLCADLMCGNPTWQMKDLAEALHLDPSMVTRLLSPSKCIEAAQNALREETITLRDCYALSQLSPEDQVGLLSLRLSGKATLAEVEERSRQKRQPAKPEDKVRLSKIKCPMQGGVVQVTGDDLSLSDMIGLLTELLKQARKSADEGCDAKAFMALLAARMKDKAKAAS